jgi:hypothetical protein
MEGFAKWKICQQIASLHSIHENVISQWCGTPIHHAVVIAITICVAMCSNDASTLFIFLTLCVDPFSRALS